MAERMPRASTHLFSAFSAFSVLALLAVGCGNGAVCDADALRAALAAARPGDTVLVGACTVAGSFTVPSGVTLAGQGGSVLASVEGALPVVRVEGEATVRSLGLRVEHGGVGLRVSGTRVTATDLDVGVVRGLGIGLDGAGVHATHVRVHGPVDATNVLGASLDPAETGTFGIVGRALGSHEVVLDDVYVTGFSIAAVSLTEGVLRWTGRASGADVEATRGVGIALFGTDATFSSVEVAGMLGGPGMPGVGVSAAPSSTAAGRFALGDLAVRDGEGYGLFSDGADVALAGASFAHMGLAGIRLQGGTLMASALRCDGNGGAGLLAVDAESVSVLGGDLGATITRGFVTPTGTVPSGDGVQVVRTASTAPMLDLGLDDVRLVDNERAGLVLDAAGEAVTALMLTRVSVTATGTGLGAVTQNAVVAAGWDADVMRAGAAIANDPAFHGALPIQGIMMPPGLVASAPTF